MDQSGSGQSMLDVGEATPLARVQRRRRAPTEITLVLIGAASLSGCDQAPPTMVQRDLYEHRGQCVQDWGDEKKCELITDGASRGYWYGPGWSGTRGPSYRGTAATPGAPPGSAPSRNAAGTHTTVARSGFGSSASAHSGGS